MSSIVVTGTGLVTAAGLGHAVLQGALAAGQSFVRPCSDGSRGSEVSAELLFWPNEPEWQAMREYAGLGSQLAVTACQAALSSALQGASAFNPLRAASVTVASDDWTEQALFDAALAQAASPRDEARALFEGVEDTFLLRTFRWSIGFGIGSLTGFQGPSVGVDYPSLDGLSGLCHAVDLIESGEVDTVLVVGVDTRPRLDIGMALDGAARDSQQTALGFGQGAAALIFERSSSAAARGARPLARLLDCQVVFVDQLEPTKAGLAGGRSEPREFSSVPALGRLFNATALVDLCLATQWLASGAVAGRAASARAVATEELGVRGAGFAVLETPTEAASSR